MGVRTRSIWHDYWFAIVLAVGLSAATWLVAAAYHLPVRDPDGFAAQTYIRFPAIVVGCVLADILPRCIYRARHRHDFGTQFLAVVRERWTLRHVATVAMGLGAWYVTYVAFRNLKSFVPFVRESTLDGVLADLDRAILFGYDPAVVLHSMLGTGLAAHLMSAVYIAWIAWVPLSIAAVLVWTRNARRAAWYITALCVDWVLGVALYFLVPSVGPIYHEPSNFAAMAVTQNSQIQVNLVSDRMEVLADPFATTAVQSIAAFASLHVGILVTAALIAHSLGMRTLIRKVLWVFLCLTCLATVYLGWHYLSDVFGGFALGAAGAWLGAVATGHRVRWRPYRQAQAVPSPAGAPTELADAASER
ncbi:MAG: phosphatase PAP2 family protein [Propionibacteriales bacterium]|nr:phosphatase PAP2 family protein [Propionibacteriales bacterium]